MPVPVPMDLGLGLIFSIFPGAVRCVRCAVLACRRWRRGLRTLVPWEAKRP